MQISVTLFGGLRHYLPAGSSFNKCQLDLDDGASLAQLLDKLPLPPEQAFMVLLNDEKISDQEYESITIQGDDAIVLLPPIKGG